MTRSSATESTVSIDEEPNLSGETDLEASHAQIKHEGGKASRDAEKADAPAKHLRDSDGVATQDGIPIVGLSGPEDPFSCVKTGRPK